MSIDLVHRYTGAVIYRAVDARTTKDAVEAAIEDCARLADVNLAGANLAGADLGGAYMPRANLAGADLTGAYLGRANLGGVNLARANLTSVNLIGTYLARANLTSVNLTGAHLAGTYLGRANLAGANLTGVYLGRANLTGACLTGATTMPDGRAWKKYRADHLAGICDTPALRERAVAAWGKHQWSDCPMHAALGIAGAAEAEDKAKRVGAWVALYDADLLERPKALGLQDL
jgi:uncharacterized protein YjbI with pentapeptide repeats